MICYNKIDIVLPEWSPRYFFREHAILRDPVANGLYNTAGLFNLALTAEPSSDRWGVVTDRGVDSR